MKKRIIAMLQRLAFYIMRKTDMAYYYSKEYEVREWRLSCHCRKDLPFARVMEHAKRELTLDLARKLMEENRVSWAVYDTESSVCRIVLSAWVAKPPVNPLNGGHNEIE